MHRYPGDPGNHRFSSRAMSFVEREWSRPHQVTRSNLGRRPLAVVPATFRKRTIRRLSAPSITAPGRCVRSGRRRSVAVRSGWTCTFMALTHDALDRTLRIWQPPARSKGSRARSASLSRTMTTCRCGSRNRCHDHLRGCSDVRTPGDARLGGRDAGPARNDGHAPARHDGFVGRSAHHARPGRVRGDPRGRPDPRG